MTAEEQIKHTIGDLKFQLYAALAKIEELEAKLAKPDLPPGTTDAMRSYQWG